MLDSKIKTTNSKSTSINPVVFGIKKSKAEELGFIGKDVYMKDILEAINQGKLKFNMSSPTQTNTGATAYLGFLTTLAGNPEILTEENLQNEELKDQLIQLYSGVKRSSGDDEFLQEMFLKGNYEALITYETSLINMNKQLEQKGEEPLYSIYTKDGVSRCSQTSHANIMFGRNSLIIESRFGSKGEYQKILNIFIHCI